MTVFPAPAPVRARIDIELGDIRVVAADVDEAVVDVVPTDPALDKDRKAAEQTRATLVDGVLEVLGPKRPAIVGPGRKSGSVQVSVRIPAGSALEARTAMGHIAVEGTLAEVGARTSMGDVRIDDAASADIRSGLGDVQAGGVAGDLRASTGSGEVRIARVDGQALVKNSNGPTWIGSTGSSARIKAANGDVRVDRAHGDVMATSANGSLAVGSAERGSLMLHTALGAIVVGVPYGTAARLDLRTSYGVVRNGLDPAASPVEGELTLEVDAQTGAGDIDVVRAFDDVA
jgi:DUF4097 and DUF4098 domain-containing protein YvlB